jgi:hypothetical protein
MANDMDEESQLSSSFFEKKLRKKLFLCWDWGVAGRKPMARHEKRFLVSRAASVFLRKKNRLLFFSCLTACAPPLAAPDLRVKADAYVPALDNGVFVSGRVPAAWWEIFGSPALDGLVAAGLQASPTLAQADAQLDQAQGSANAANGVFLPQIGLNPNVTRAAYPTGPNGSPPYTIYSLVGTVSYDPGLFGARHYTFENGAAQIAYGQAELDAARQTLSGNIVSAAISEAGYEAQVGTTRNIIAAEQKLLNLLNGEFADGAIPRLSVLQQQSQIAATEATLYPADGCTDRAGPGGGADRAVAGRSDGDRGDADWAWGAAEYSGDIAIGLSGRAAGFAGGAGECGGAECRFGPGDCPFISGSDALGARRLRLADGEHAVSDGCRAVAAGGEFAGTVIPRRGAACTQTRRTGATGGRTGRVSGRGAERVRRGGGCAAGDAE